MSLCREERGIGDPRSPIPKFRVHSPERTGFDRAQRWIADTLLLVPARSWAAAELSDALPVALAIFLEITRNFCTTNIENWDHGCTQSRLAASMACGLAIKLVMDRPPIGTMYCLNAMVKRAELGMVCVQAALGPMHTHTHLHTRAHFSRCPVRAFCPEFAFHAS
jgi:hypothetical protein